jgi:regulator of replication initiation timing
MLRICLVLVIVVALAALGLSQNVATKLQSTKDELGQTQTTLTTTQTQLSKAKNDERTAKLQAEELRTQLETSELGREEALARSTQQQNRADDLENRLTDALRGRNEARDRLAEWDALGKTPQQVQEVLIDNERLSVDMAALSQENLVLQREVVRLDSRLRRYEGEDVKVELPAGLKGRVLAVDPKFEFVVLDIGSDKGVLERGEMLVSRSGKLVARVRIMSVRDNTCVANVMADWKQAEVLEGDQATVGL